MIDFINFIAASAAKYASSLSLQSLFRFVVTVISSAGAGAGALRFGQLRLRNRRLKIRTIELAKLREHVRQHADKAIFIRPAVMRILSGANAYHVEVPQASPEASATTVCIHSRQTLPEGHYSLECRCDSVVFTLLRDDDRKTPTPFAIAMFVAKNAQC